MKSQQWEGKINRARYVERNICSWVKRNHDPNAYVVEGYVPERDIVSEVMGDLEVKEDRMAHVTDNYALEYENGQGQPSGVMGTHAKHFVLVDYDTVCIMATESLRYLLREMKNKRTLEMGERFNNGKRVKGWLVSRHIIQTSPYVKVIPRWFPVLQENEVR